MKTTAMIAKALHTLEQWQCQVMGTSCTLQMWHSLDALQRPRNETLVSWVERRKEWREPAHAAQVQFHKG